MIRAFAILLCLSLLFLGCSITPDYARIDQKIETGKPVNIYDLFYQYFKTNGEWPENLQQIKKFCKLKDVSYDLFFKEMSDIELNKEKNGDLILHAKHVTLVPEIGEIDSDWSIRFKKVRALRKYSIKEFSEKWKKRNSLPEGEDYISWEALYKALINEKKETVLEILGEPDSIGERDNNEEVHYYELDKMWTLILFYNKEGLLIELGMDD